MSETGLPAKYLSPAFLRAALTYAADFGLRLAVQVAYFFVLARALGPAGYGTFATVSAFTMLASTFSGLGSDQLLFKRVAADRNDFRLAFGNALLWSVVTFPPLLALTFLAIALFPLGQISISVILLIGMSDILLVKGQWTANLALQAHQIARSQLLINTFTSLAKLLCAWIAATAADQLTLESWAFWYLVACLASLAFALAVVTSTLGAPRFQLRWSDAPEGVLYAVESAAMNGIRDLDRPIVTATLGAYAAGIYTAAFRIVDMACIPIRALLSALYARFFYAAHERGGSLTSLLKNSLLLLTATAIAVAIGLAVIAPFLSRILGPEYNEAVPVIMALLAYPLFLSWAAVVGDAMRARGQQKARVVIVVITVVLNLGLVAVAAMFGGLIGIAIAKLAAQLFAALAAFVAFAVGGRSREQTP